MLFQRFSIEQSHECTRPLAHAIALEVVTPSLILSTGPCCRSSCQALRLQHHSRVPRSFKVAFSAAHALKPCLMFGASASMRNASGRHAHAQSGCLPYGSLLTKQQRQSATRHRQVSRASCGARRTEASLPGSASIRQNLLNSKQGSAAMHKPNINIHRQIGMLSCALSPAPRLTRRSTGHQRAAHVAAS
jgi:hypothetical protein